MKSRAVMWSLNRLVFVNLPIHVPRLTRFSLAMLVAFLMISSLETKLWYTQKHFIHTQSVRLGWISWVGLLPHWVNSALYCIVSAAKVNFANLNCTWIEKILEEERRKGQRYSKSIFDQSINQSINLYFKTTVSKLHCMKLVNYGIIASQLIQHTFKRVVSVPLSQT